MAKQLKDICKKISPVNYLYIEHNGEFGQIGTKCSNLIVKGDCFMIEVTEDELKGKLPLDKKENSIKRKNVIVHNNMNGMSFLSACNIEMKKVNKRWFLCGVWLFGSHQSVKVDASPTGLILSEDNGVIYC